MLKKFWNSLEGSTTGLAMYGPGRVCGKYHVILKSALLPYMVWPWLAICASTLWFVTPTPLHILHTHRAGLSVTNKHSSIFLTVDILWQRLISRFQPWIMLASLYIDKWYCKTSLRVGRSVFKERKISRVNWWCSCSRLELCVWTRPTQTLYIARYYILHWIFWASCQSLNKFHVKVIQQSLWHQRQTSQWIHSWWLFMLYIEGMQHCCHEVTFVCIHLIPTWRASLSLHPIVCILSSCNKCQANSHNNGVYHYLPITIIFTWNASLHAPG